MPLFPVLVRKMINSFSSHQNNVKEIIIKNTGKIPGKLAYFIKVDLELTEKC